MPRFSPDYAKLAPPGVKPNYVDPVTNDIMYELGALITLSVAFLCVLIRITAKMVNLKKSIGWDDYLAVAALLFAIARSTAYIYDMKHYGVGRHIWDVPLPVSDNLWGLWSVAQVMYPPGMLCAKLSILLFYLSIFGINKRFKWTCYAVIFFNAAYLSANCLVYIFWCSPPITTWHISRQTENTKCVDGYAETLTIGSFNIITDVVIMVLPLPMIWKLQTSNLRRFQLMIVFSVGIICVITAIIRVSVISQKLKGVVVTPTDAKTAAEDDQTWAEIYEMTWLSIELHMAIIASCLLVSPSFFTYMYNNTAVGHSLQDLIHSIRSSTSSRTQRISHSSEKSSYKQRMYKRQNSDGDLELVPGQGKTLNAVYSPADNEGHAQSEMGSSQLIKETRTFATTSERLPPEIV